VPEQQLDGPQVLCPAVDQRSLGAPQRVGPVARRDQPYAYLAKAWPSVLKNLQKSFVDGPYDRTVWIDQLRNMQEKK